MNCLDSSEYRTLFSSIDHFTVSCLVAWPLNESEAGGDLVLIETSSRWAFCLRVRDRKNDRTQSGAILYGSAP